MMSRCIGGIAFWLLAVSVLSAPPPSRLSLALDQLGLNSSQSKLGGLETSVTECIDHDSGFEPDWEACNTAQIDGVWVDFYGKTFPVHFVDRDHRPVGPLPEHTL